MEQEVILFKIDVDVEQAQKDVISYQVELEKLKKEKKAIEEANKKGELSEEEYAKAIVNTNNAIKATSASQKEATKQIELADKAAKASKNSYQSLTLQYQEAKKKLNELENAFEVNADGTIELTDAYKAQAEEVKKLKDAIIDFDQGVSDGRSNVGNYKKTLEEALGQTTIFGISLENGKKAFQAFTKDGIGGAIKGLFDLAKSVLTSPLGLLVITIGTITALFSKSRAVTQAFGQVLESLGQVFNAVFKLAEPIIEGFASIVSFGAEALSSVVEFFDSSSKNAASLEKNLQGVNDKLALQADIQKRLELEAQKQKNIVEDTTQATEDRLKAARKQFDFETQSIQSTLELEQQKAKVLQDQIKNLGNTNERFEKQKELTEQNAKVSELINQKEKFREELIKKTNELLVEQQGNLIALNEANLNLALATGKVRKDSKEQLDLEIKNIKDKADLELKGTKDIVKQDAIIAQSKADVANKEREFTEKQIELNKKATDDQKARLAEIRNINRQISQDAIDTNLARLQKELSDFDKQTSQINQKDKIALQERANERLKFEQLILDEQIKARQLQEKNELEDARLRAKELQALGINSTKFLEAERKKIIEQSNSDIQVILNDFATTQLENAKTQAELLRQTINNENTKRLADEAIFLQNQIAQQKAFGELATEQQIELAKTRNSQTLEALNQQLANEEITRQQYEAQRLEAKIAYEGQIKAIENEALQQKIARINAEAELNAKVVGLFKDLGDAFGSLTEQNTEAGKALFVFQKALALAEIAINLQKELSLIASNPALNADPTQISKGIAIASAIARGVKVISDVRKIGFAEGGYTGDGSKYEPAGLVHKGEYVIPKWQNENSSYKPLIQALEVGRLRGYATGGNVGTNTILENLAPSNNLTTSVVEILKNAQFVVGVREIIDTANRVQVVEQQSNF